VEGVALNADSAVAALFLHFVLMSLMSVGGVGSVLPDVQRYVVEVQHWLTAKQFADSFALGNAAPGPNMMYVALIGWQVAGFAGALAATLGMILPTATLTLGVVRWNALAPDTRAGRALREGLAPITIGLILASGWVLVGSSHDWRGYALTGVTVVAFLRTRWNPLWLVAAGALAGIAGIV
jgi:chromate transporter